MKRFGLYKKEKLCSPTAIDKLFAGGGEYNRLVYPVRVVAAEDSSRRSDAPVAFLVSVPKKRIRHAVDRVLVRRRIREAFRLLHHNFEFKAGLKVNVAFIYVANAPVEYSRISTAMERLLGGLEHHFSPKDVQDS